MANVYDSPSPKFKEEIKESVDLSVGIFIENTVEENNPSIFHNENGVVPFWKMYDKEKNIYIDKSGEFESKIKKACDKILQKVNVNAPDGKVGILKVDVYGIKVPHKNEEGSVAACCGGKAEKYSEDSQLKNANDTIQLGGYLGDLFKQNGIEVETIKVEFWDPNRSIISE